MNDTSDSQRTLIARWSLVLFLFGLLAPLVLILLALALAGPKSPETALDDAAPFAIALGVIAEVLALVLWLVAASGARDPQSAFPAKCALILFIAGPLAPCGLILLVAAIRESKTLDAAVPYAIALGIAAEVLALILGAIVRRQVAGKTALVGAAVLVGLVLAAAVFCLAMTLRDSEQRAKERVETNYGKGTRQGVEKSTPP